MFYEGGLQYHVARSLPLPELILIQKAAKKVEEERKQAMKRAQAKKS